uniref:Uncharacterized protein n=1 Tax=Oryza nivara TaxID=4536 RepID=A0A0E0J1U6_ORYNI
MARGSTLLLPQVQVDFLPGQPTKIWLVIGGVGAVYKEAKDEGQQVIGGCGAVYKEAKDEGVVCCCFY